jgi:N-acyl-L-homoserine lactone synthetase
MSSAGNKYITNKEAIPLVSGNVFSNHKNNRFALGVFSSNDVLSYEPNTIAQAYLQLRANVYIDQTKMLDSNVRRSDGTELDEDDERSTHFVVLENLMGKMAVFACMRFIEKTVDRDSILPIEEFFPDAFVTHAPNKSVEVSRFIARHDEVKYCLIAKRELMTAALAYALNNNLGPVFGVVEPEFERDLKMMKVPIRRIAEPKLVPEYNDENLGIEVDKYEFKNRVGKAAIDRMTIPVGSFGYWGHI